MNTDLHVYLDDKRFPKTDRPWTIVRDYDAFVALIKEQGFPAVLSFDHDLDDDSPTGMACAKWLVDLGLELDVNPRDIEWNVHSANPVGAANIRGIYASWIKFWDMTQEA